MNRDSGIEARRGETPLGGSTRSAKAPVREAQSPDLDSTTPTTGEDDVERAREIEDLFEAADQEPCTCNIDENACPHCSKWEKAVRALRAALAATSPTTEDAEKRELVEAFANCTGIESGPNGHGGMRVVVHFQGGGDEHALFTLLNKALASIGERS